MSPNPTLDNGVRAAGALAGTALTFLFGSELQALLILTILVVLDYMTGLGNALATGTASSEIGLRGIVKKATMFAVIVVAHMLDVALDSGRPIMAMAVTWFLIANEGLSILENAAALGVPMPARLRVALEKVRDDNNPGGA